jgi:hypothetical protein
LTIFSSIEQHEPPTTLKNSPATKVEHVRLLINDFIPFFSVKMKYLIRIPLKENVKNLSNKLYFIHEHFFLANNQRPPSIVSTDDSEGEIHTISDDSNADFKEALARVNRRRSSD